MIQFQTAEEIDAARRKHLERTTLIGGTAGAAALGVPTYLLNQSLGPKWAAGIGALHGIKGGLAGGAAGLGVGLLTRPKRPKIEEYNRRNELLEKLSAKLDDLIEFQKKYPSAVLESVWRNLKKPSRRTLGGILRRSGKGKMPTMVFRGLHTAPVEESFEKAAVATHSQPIPPRPVKYRYLSGKLDDLIQFQDTRPRNPEGEFTSQQQGPDPNAMEKTYRSGLHRGILEGGVTAAIGGTSGVLATSAAKNIAARIRTLRKGKISRIIKP